MSEIKWNVDNDEPETRIYISFQHADLSDPVNSYRYVAFEACGDNYYPENRTYMLKNWFIQ